MVGEGGAHREESRVRHVVLQEAVQSSQPRQLNGAVPRDPRPAWPIALHPLLPPSLPQPFALALAGRKRRPLQHALQSADLICNPRPGAAGAFAERAPAFAITSYLTHVTVSRKRHGRNREERVNTDGYHIHVATQGAVVGKEAHRSLGQEEGEAAPDVEGDERNGGAPVWDAHRLLGRLRGGLP